MNTRLGLPHWSRLGPCINSSKEGLEIGVIVRKVFEGVLPPSSHEVDDDVKKSLVVLDTNVLLNLYRLFRIEGVVVL